MRGLAMGQGKRADWRSGHSRGFSAASLIIPSVNGAEIEISPPFPVLLPNSESALPLGIVILP